MALGQRVKFANEAKLHGQGGCFLTRISLGVALVDDNNVIWSATSDYTTPLIICLSVLIPVTSPVTFNCNLCK